MLSLFLWSFWYASVFVWHPILGEQWWTRYQPVSYLLESRSGTRSEFIDMVNRCRASGVNTHGAIGKMTPTKRSIKNDHMGTSGMTPKKFWYQNFFSHPGLPLHKILKNCWRAPWPARRPEILHAGHWPQYATFMFYTNFCAMKFLLIRFLKNALWWVYGSGSMVGEGGPEGDTTTIH